MFHKWQKQQHCYHCLQMVKVHEDHIHNIDNIANHLEFHLRHRVLRVSRVRTKSESKCRVTAVKSSEKPIREEKQPPIANFDE